MRDYFKVTSVSERELNEYLEKGWKIIESVKSKGEYDEYVNYHVGFPIKDAFEIARNLLFAFESRDLKSQLLKAEAEQIGEDLDEYGPFTGNEVSNSLVDMLEQMDFILTKKDKPKYYKRKELDNDFFG